MRRQVLDLLPVEQDQAVGHLLKASDHVQRRRLAAPGRPEEHRERPVIDHEVDTVDGDHGAECLAQTLQLDRRQCRQPFVDPDRIPRTRKRCSKSTSKIVGSAASSEPAAIIPNDCSRML